MNILYADEDRDDCDFFSEAIKNIDPSHTCIIARSGIEALNFLQKGEVIPDVIFLDGSMMVMDGQTCLKEIKKISRLKDVPVIVSSVDSRGMEKYKQLGAIHFFAKPNNFSDLQEVIKSAFKTLKNNSTNLGRE